MANKQVVFATESWSTVLDGARVRVSKDQAYYSTDPVVKAAPDKFSDVPASLLERDRRDAALAERQAELSGVEQATAAPGEKRSVKKTAAKK